MGADLNLSNTLDLEANSTLDMGGHALNAQTVYLGYNYGQPVTLLNRGTITAENLYVGPISFSFNPADTGMSFLPSTYLAGLFLGGVFLGFLGSLTSLKRFVN